MNLENNQGIILCNNIRRYENVDFDAYKGSPGYNYSFLKRERAGIATELTMSDKIMLGTLVDAILTGGAVNMRHAMYPHAKKIAAKLKDTFGSILPFFKKQISYNADFHYKGFVLPVRGRVDFELQPRMIVDLKVTGESNIGGLIDHMKYADQQFAYRLMAQVPECYLLIYSYKTQSSKVISLPATNYSEFWADKIIRFGSAD